MAARELEQDASRLYLERQYRSCLEKLDKIGSFTGLNRASFHHNRCVVEHLLQGGKFALRDENIVTKLKSLLSSRSDTEDDNIEPEDFILMKYNLAIALFRSGNFRETINTLEAAAQDAAKTLVVEPSLVLRLHLVLTEARMRCGQVPAAEQTLTLLSELANASPPATSANHNSSSQKHHTKLSLATDLSAPRTPTKSLDQPSSDSLSDRTGRSHSPSSQPSSSSIPSRMPPSPTCDTFLAQAVGKFSEAIESESSNLEGGGEKSSALDVHDTHIPLLASSENKELKTKESLNNARSSEFKPSASHFKFYLNLQRARLHMQRQDLRSAKKEIKSALQLYQRDHKERKVHSSQIRVSRGLLAVDSCDALILKARLEFIKQNYEKAVEILFLQATRLLTSCVPASAKKTLPLLWLLQNSVFNAPAVSSSTNDRTIPLPMIPSLPVPELALVNNAACIALHAGRASAAVFFLKHASRMIKVIASGHQANERLISRNLAIALLEDGKWTAAASQFESSLCQGGQNDPLLWMRAAQCAIASFMEMETNTSLSQISSPSLVKPMVEDSHSSPRKVKSCPGIYGTKVHKQIAKDGILSLNHAEKCLVNARLLLVAQNHSFEQNDVISEIEEKASSEVSSLLVVCLLQLAYVRLCCGDFVSVLSSVDECIGLLSKLSHTPENEKLKQRAGLYACEACCKLDLPSKALVYLAHQSTSTQDNTSARVQFTSISPSSAVEHALLKAAFHTNMACVQAAQGLFSRAFASVKRALSHHRYFSPALRTLIYLQLKTGDTMAALYSMKNHSIPPNSNY